MFIPYRVDVPMQRWPISNFVIIGRPIIAFLWISLLLAAFPGCEEKPAALTKKGPQNGRSPVAGAPGRSAGPIDAKRRAREHKVVHVFVALCDNKHQGIVPVPAALGNGQDPRNNLYWGAMYGAKTFFRKSPHWAQVTFVRKPNKRFANEPHQAVLDSCVFKSVGLTPPVYVVAEAWDGKHMRPALQAFLLAAAGELPTDVLVNEGEDGRRLLAGGEADLVCFVGHNGLMDVRLSEFPKGSGRGSPECAVVLACKSRDYFVKPLAAARCRPLITTTGLMAPEAYTLDAIIRSWAAGDAAAVTRRKAGAAYAKYQKISQRAAERLFAARGE